MKTIRKCCIYVLGLFPLLSLQMVSIALILFFVGGIMGYKKNNIPTLDKKHTYKILFFTSLPLLLYILSLLWTENISYGISSIVKSLSFIILPVAIFVLKPFSKSSQIIDFIKVFMISTACLSLVTLVLVIIKLLIIDEVNTDISNYALIHLIRRKIEETPLVGEHPIYYTLLQGTALISLVFYRFKSTVLNGIVLTLLLIGVFLASSRGPLLALFIVFGTIILKAIKNRFLAICLTILFFALSSIVVANTPLKSRFLEVTNTRFFYPQGIYYNSFNTRMGIYKCCIELSKNIPILGFGGGDVQKELDQCYDRSFTTSAYDNRKLNSHNQFFHFWLSFGPIGFTLIIISFVFFFREAWLFKNGAYLSFLIFFFISFLFENILNRNTGIVLFSMFNCLFYFLKVLESDNS